MTDLLRRQRPARRATRPVAPFPWRPVAAAAAVVAAVLAVSVGAGRLAARWGGGGSFGGVGPTHAAAILRQGDDGALAGALVVEIRERDASVDLKVIPADRRLDGGTLAEAFAAGGPAAAAALAGVIGRPPESYVVVGPDGLARFVDALGGIALPVRDEIRYEEDGSSVIIPADLPRYDGDLVEAYLRYPWRDRKVAIRTVAMGCLGRLADLAEAGVPVGEIWAALGDSWDGTVTPEVFSWTAGVARGVGPTALAVEAP